MPETLADILAVHRAGRVTPEETVERSYVRIKAHADPAVFIMLREEADARAEARALAGRGDLPLHGIPVAVKDNIDVKGLATTAACPAFRYEAGSDAGPVARLRQAGAIDYRLYALVGKEPPRPGLMRMPDGEGTAIEIEVWALPTEAFGRFVAAVPPPLSIGTVTLADGRAVKGFLVEAQGIAGARDISSFGGWRAFIRVAQESR